MLAILLKILSILGIVLLILICILALLLLLVLFFPVSYRLFGKKSGTKAFLQIRVSWLFGVLLADGAYPDPGGIRIRLFGVTLFDSKAPGADRTKETKKEESGQTGTEQRESVPKESGKKEESSKENREEKEGKAENVLEREEKAHEESRQNFLFGKYKKILYTFQKFYDKIRHIWENISYYKALFHEEDTRLLFSHAKKRVGTVLKSLRPRRLRAHILFGTGSPDTTGYAYGVYGMISCFFGREVSVIPDFDRSVLEGELYAAGRITAFCVLWNGMFLLLDRRLRWFMEKLRKGRSENGR